MKIVILPEVVDYLLELSDILYDKGYFGFEEAAIKYTDELFEAIKTELPYQSPKIAPEWFKKFGDGMYYAIIWSRNVYNEKPRKMQDSFVTFRYQKTGSINWLLKNLI